MARRPNQSLTQIENEQLRSLKARFDAANSIGMAALKRGDHRAAGEAIRLQREILDEQRNLLLFKLHRVESKR